MVKLYRYLYLLIVISLIVTACSPRATQAPFVIRESFQHGDLLGKSLHDMFVEDWMTANHCASASPFQVCKDAGIAVWLDAEQTVKKIYLYLNNQAGFHPFQGPLPLGLKFYDTMGAVEYKLGKLDVREGLHKAENAGLPEEGASPDHVHYWAVYKRYGITIIYNSPSVDEDATIYAIVVSDKKEMGS